MDKVFEALKPHVCPWCLKRFEEAHSAETHMLQKHRRYMPLTADAKVQQLHAEKLREAIGVLMTVSPEMRTAIVRTILPKTHDLVFRHEGPTSVTP